MKVQWCSNQRKNYQHVILGLRGLMLAALLAALMSTLTSIFNSASSMATLDIWRKIRKQAKEHELMIVGRATVLILVGLSIAWIPMVEHGQGPQLWSYLQAIAAYTAPPWCVIFLMALFWRRTTEQVFHNGCMPILEKVNIELIRQKHLHISYSKTLT